MADDIRKIKTELRRQYKAMRLAMEDEDKAHRDEKIFEKLKTLWAFRDCDTLYTYVSTPIEVDTKKIIEYCLQTGRRVAVPLCGEVTGEMDFYYIDSLSQLSPGHFGVWEPEADESRRADGKSGLCLVPGLSFDKEGYRLGYGKGYYDRFLSAFGGQSVGLCYEECIRSGLVHGRYDKTIPTVVTDKRIYVFT